MAYEDIERKARDLERQLIRDKIGELQARLADIDAHDPEAIEREQDRYVDGLFGMDAGRQAPRNEDEALDRIFGTDAARELTEDERLDRMFGLGVSGTEAQASENAFTALAAS